MARLIGKLTAKEVAKKTQPGLYGDGAGLTLQITRSGVKSWLFRFMVDGRAFAMGLGPLHTVTLAEAREKAIAARKMLINGLNPLAERKKDRAEARRIHARAMTFDQCAEAYIRAHRPRWNNSKHADQWVNTLASYASPILGSLPIDQVDTALIVKVLTQATFDGHSLWEGKHETASRIRGRVEAIINWATTSGLRTGENPARWKGHLENLLPPVKAQQLTKNLPSLPWHHLGSFMKALRMQEGIAARALEFAILTAARSGEVRGARWREIDLQSGIWRIPAERMKAKREHEIPLSTAAVDLLRRLPRIDTSEFIFPGTRGQPLSDMSLTSVIRRMNRKSETWTDEAGKVITVHGFRSTFRMWAGESTNYPREVAEHALAHQLPDAVERAYQRGTLFAKRARLMADWGTFCATEFAEHTAVIAPIRSAV